MLAKQLVPGSHHIRPAVHVGSRKQNVAHRRRFVPRARIRQCRATAGYGSSDSDSSRPEQQQQQQQHDTTTHETSSSSQLSMEQQHLQQAMKRLQALEDYQQLLAQSDSTGSSGSSSGSSTSSSGSSTSSSGSTKGENDIPLLEAALLIARHAHPDLDAAAVRQRLDELAAEVEARLPSGVRYPLRIIREINHVLYEVHGFAGNTDDYYHPSNSCINRVLETKKGIPITLSLVYMEVAARLGLKMGGVNLPAHFMIRPQVEGMEWLVDAFHGGELTALQDAEQVLSRLTGYQVKLDPRFVAGDPPPVSSRSMLLRMLNNLRQTYVTLNMAEEALGIIRYMQVTAPLGSLPELLRDEGLCLYRLGRLPEASRVLTDYLAQQPGSQDAGVVEAVLQRIREQAAAAAAAAAALQEEEQQ